MIVIYERPRRRSSNGEGPVRRAPPPVVVGKLENPMLNLNRASVLLVCFVLCWLALVEVLRSGSFFVKRWYFN